MRFEAGFRARSIVASLVIVVMGFVWFVPVYSLIVGSLKTLREVQGTPVIMPPREIEVGTVLRVLDEMKAPVFNTIIVVLPVALIATALGTLAAYSIYRSKSRVGDLTMILIAIATYVPYHAVLIPLINVVDTLGLYDRLPGVALGLLVYYTPMATLLMFIFMTVIPRDYVEAAMVDGASDFRILRRVIAPLLGPGVTSTIVFILIMTWNNFYIPLILSRGYENHVTLKIFSYVGQSGNLYNEMFAAALIGSLPPLIIFLLLGRYFIRGLQAFGAGARG